MKNNGANMEWFKKHMESLIIIGMMFSGFLWMNGKFNDIDRRFYQLENRLSKIETIMIVKGICSSEILGSNKE